MRSTTGELSWSSDDCASNGNDAWLSLAPHCAPAGTRSLVATHLQQRPSLMWAGLTTEWPSKPAPPRRPRSACTDRPARQHQQASVSPLRDAYILMSRARRPSGCQAACCLRRPVGLEENEICLHLAEPSNHLVVFAVSRRDCAAHTFDAASLHWAGGTRHHQFVAAQLEAETIVQQ